MIVKAEETKKVKGNKLTAWIRNKWDIFSEWWFSPWTLKDHFAWYGFCCALGYVIRCIIGFIRFVKRFRK